MLARKPNAAFRGSGKYVVAASVDVHQMRLHRMIHLENEHRPGSKRPEEGVLIMLVEGAGDSIAPPPRGFAQLQSLQCKGVNVLRSVPRVMQGQMAGQSVLTYQEEASGD
jgi:hypothetical protein